MEGMFRAWIGGRWRAVRAPRKIEQGRYAGRYEVSVNEISQPKDGPWRVVTRRRVVDAVREVG